MNLDLDTRARILSEQGMVLGADSPEVWAQVGQGLEGRESRSPDAVALSEREKAEALSFFGGLALGGMITFALWGMVVLVVVVVL